MIANDTGQQPRRVVRCDERPGNDRDAGRPAELRHPAPPRLRASADGASVAAAAARSRTTEPADWGEVAGSNDGAWDSEFLAFERQRLVDALEKARGNKSEAARLLGMPRSTLCSKLKKHGML